MPRQSILEMPFARVYPLLVQKAERKGRTKAEVDELITWLTGYPDPEACAALPCGEYYANAPCWNPAAEKITGAVCGVRVETVQDPVMKRIRQLDKLIDELARGKPLEKIKRSCLEPGAERFV